MQNCKKLFNKIFNKYLAYLLIISGVVAGCGDNSMTFPSNTLQVTENSQFNSSTTLATPKIVETASQINSTPKVGGQATLAKDNSSYVSNAISTAIPPSVKGQPLIIEGVFFIIWGDPDPNSNNASAMNYFLGTDNGQSIRLLIDEKLIQILGNINSLNRKLVIITGETQTLQNGISTAIRVLSIKLKA